MQFAFTSEQQEFRSVLRRYFEETSPPQNVRRLMETERGWDLAQWKDMNAQLGLAGMFVPEPYGGSGFGLVELSIVLEEMGRALVCAPYFASSVLATAAIINAGSEAEKQALLPALALGEQIGAFAFTEPNGRWDASGIEMVASEASGGFRLSGVKSFVLDGAAADVIVVLARSAGSRGEDGLSFFTVCGDAKGLVRTALKTMDATRRLARLEFRHVEATPLGARGAGAAPFATTMAQAAIALSNEMIGGAERLRESALDYAKLRMQFGRSLASFQTMKHKQADMLLEVELAKSAAYAAASAADDGDPEWRVHASMAKAAASEAYLQTAIHTIQIHGGIGFTWDNDTHLWFKRAKSSEVFLGDATWHREQMLRGMGH